MQVGEQWQRPGIVVGVKVEVPGGGARSGEIWKVPKWCESGRVKRLGEWVRCGACGEFDGDGGAWVGVVREGENLEW